MKLTTAIRVIAAAVCGLFLLTGCSQPDKGQQPQKELTKMTMLISSDAPDCVRSAAEEFINRAAFYSDGELEISLSESQQVETILESSEAEFAFVSNEELVSSVPELETLNLPFYFKHEDYQFSALNAQRTKKRLNELLSAVYPMEVQMATVCGYEDLAADAQVDLTDFRKRYPLAVKTSYFSDQLQEEIGAREIVSDNPFQLLLDGGAEIAQASLSQVIETVDCLVMDGRELSQLAADFTWYLRNLLLVKCSDNMEDVLDVSSENLAQLKEEAGMIENETLIRYIRVFSDLTNQLRYSTQKRVLLEVTLIRLCRPAMEQTEDALLDRIRMMEKQIEEMEEEVRSAPRRMQEYPDDPDGREWPSREEPRAPKPQLPKALNEDVKAVAKDFRSILGDASPMLRTYLKKARLSAGEGNVLLIVAPDEISAGALGTEEHKEEIRRLIEEKIGKQIEVEVRSLERGGRFEDSFVDLEKLIHMEITVED